MKKILFSAWMVAWVALAGCQQNDELTGVENTLGKKVSVTANIKANAQSRVAMEYVTGADGGSTIKVVWKGSGESFQMYDATDDTKVSTFTQTSGNQFEGALPGESGDYYAVYGSIDNLANQDGTLKEDYVWMMDDDVTDLTETIEFIHQTTVLKPNFRFDGVPINNESITKIVMDGISLPGDAEAITITPSEVEDIFIFLPAVNFIEEGTTFNFTVTTADYKVYEGTLTISKNMEQGYFYTANIHFEKVAEFIPYVTFTADAEQKLSYEGNDLQYSTDGNTFVSLEAGKEISFGGETKLYLRGEDNLDGNYYRNFIYPSGYKISFVTNAPVACTGDIRTLIDWETYKTVDTSEASFRSLFESCRQLTSAPALPATTLTKNCYRNMFYYCTSLKTAPALPATTLKDNCYESMFEGCTSLKTAPALPATTLANSCYSRMFNTCTSLEKAPALPAETLKDNCYYYMFWNCRSLKIAPALPATTLANSCYDSMFYGCTSLEKAPALPAETLKDNCYRYMFYYCTSLKTAPELPATTLAPGCYRTMFSGCRSLNNITMLATDISAEGCLDYWVEGVAATGTFKKAASVTIPEGVSGIPTGWTVVEQ